MVQSMGLFCHNCSVRCQLKVEVILFNVFNNGCQKSGIIGHL